MTKADEMALLATWAYELTRGLRRIPEANLDIAQDIARDLITVVEARRQREDEQDREETRRRKYALHPDAGG